MSLMPRSFVLKGNIIYSRDLENLSVTEGGFVVCENSISRGVFRQLPKQYESLPLLDYGENIIIPGLTDLHIHAPQFAYRGTGMDLELLQWLNENAFPEEARFKDPSYARKAYHIFAQTLRKSASTRLVVFGTRHCDATTILMEELEQTGLVSFVGKVNMNRLAPEDLVEKSSDESYSETLRWLENIKGRFSNTYPIITPRFVPSCTDDLLRRLGELSHKERIPVQSHLSENLSEIELVRDLVPSSSFYADAYDMFGLFGSDSIPCVMAHCVHSSEPEIALMRKNNVFVAHCPECNANIASGIAPIRHYLESGLNIGLGSDIAGGATESIFSAMTDAIRMSKLHWRLVDQSARPLKFPEAFYLATKGGGAFFGKVGSFDEGFEFDALVLSDDNIPYPRYLDPQKRLERFSYVRGAVSGGIVSKFVRGERLF